MTVTPLPLPVNMGPGSAPVPMGADAEASAQTFAALVTQLMSGQGKGVPASGIALPGAKPGIDIPATGVPGATVPAVGTPGATQPVPAVPGAPVPAPVVALQLPGTTVTEPTDDSAEDLGEATDGDDSAEAGSQVAPQAAGFLAVLPVVTQPTVAADAPVPTATPAVTGATTATSTPATAPSTGAAAGSTDDAGTPAPAAGSKQHDAPVDGAAPAAPATSSTTTGVTPAVGAESVAGPTGPATDARPTPASAVTRQVFPEVTRLVSAGNGTHRVRLQLEPEALGDVRVVLTVRRGEVHVQLSGGEDAQRALREGAPELRRLLELAGASDSRIVVRDLSSGSASGNATTFTGQGTGGFGRGDSGVGQGGDGSQHQHAGTRDGSSAREGNNDGAVPHRPVQPVTRTHSGVDVSM